MLVLALAVALEVRNTANGLVGVLVAAACGAAGPAIFAVVRRRAGR